ncbi:MAG: hypothetical protein NG737_04910 [Omnitrophica bacterium]|nr:hypothetical protein [Candidatus Omnitrophota bacterium]
MKIQRIFLFAFLLASLCFNLAFADKNIRVIGGVNKIQPISPGEVIYDEILTIWSNSYSQYQVRYTYIGIEQNNIKIRYRYKIDEALARDGLETETDILLLPLDRYGKAYLELHALPRLSRRPTIPRKNLIITVDNKQRLNIVVESLSKYKDKSW